MINSVNGQHNLSICQRTVKLTDTLSLFIIDVAELTVLRNLKLH